MALLNFIGPGTYSTVAILNYDYGEKQIDIQVKTYTDSTKNVLIATNVFQLMLNDSSCRTVKSIISTPPESPQVGDMYLIVDPDPNSSLAYCNGAILIYKDNLATAFEYLSSDICIIDESTGDKYLTMQDGTRELSPDHIIIDRDAWDAICGISSLEADQSTILKRAYDYLKTLSIFSEVIDG